MYSKNDYRYYLEHRLAQSDDFLAHYGIKGMKWKKKKGGSDAIEKLKRLHRENQFEVYENGNKLLKKADKRTKDNVIDQQYKGMRRTRRTNVRAEQEHRNKRTTTKPNMYSTNKKAKYEDQKYNHHYTISTGGSTTSYTSYGQNQKKKDIKADKKMRSKAINEANPYKKYDKKKSLKSNINTNKAIANKRKREKKKAHAKVDRDYKNV